VHPPSNRRLVVQASEAWIEWVEQGAEFCRTDVSKLTDAAIVTYLIAQGFTKPAPKRVL
jgi:hypothetical protein